MSDNNDFDDITDGPISVDRAKHHCGRLAIDCGWRAMEVEQHIDDQAKRIAELEEAVRELAETVVTFWTSADFVTRSDSLTKARKNTIACRAIDEARGIK